MTFEQFRTNVEAWAIERGIYEHSTALAQALKACSEAGELCDAVIKGDREALIDAIGDVAVCLVNYAALEDHKLKVIDVKGSEHQELDECAWTCVMMMAGIREDSRVCDYVLGCLDLIARVNGLDFMVCCESAWHEIKDRKGHMVAGGAFVKE
jgi:NTP pyrophosphatase (non-canonical NTP hydrolase)